MKTLLILVSMLISIGPVMGQDVSIRKKITTLTDQQEANVIKWRRHLHQYPELSNREFKTAKMVADHLRTLGMEVQTEMAYTGVVGILKGGKPGPVVALRADMDGLPVTERVDIPFASKERTTYLDQEVGIMHACGHDTHVAILMGVATILTEIKKDLQGTVKFIFQPAEEGAPSDEGGGAEMMVEEGVMEDPKVDVVFGLHIQSKLEVGTIGYKPGGMMAGADFLRINVIGGQTHGASPWEGIDPIVVSAQIITGLQTIVSRQMDITNEAVVVTIGKINGGVRNNIIPERVEMIGTIRSLDAEMQEKLHQKIKQVAINIAESAGAIAEVEITKGYPVTFNDLNLTDKMLPTLQESAGAENVQLLNATMGAEDFSYYSQKAPGLFFRLGGMPKGVNPEDAAPHHTPDFFIDDSGLKLGVRTMVNLTLDYMANPGVGSSSSGD